MALLVLQFKQSCVYQLIISIFLYLEINIFPLLQHRFSHDRDGLKDRASERYETLLREEKFLNSVLVIAALVCNMRND